MHVIDLERRMEEGTILIFSSEGALTGTQTMQVHSTDDVDEVQ